MSVVEYRGRFYRVQVKSSSYRSMNSKGQTYGYPCATVRPGKRKSYRGKIDFFAYFLVPEDLWFIVPVSGLKKNRSRCAIHINPYNPRNHYFPFMEAWNLLKTASAHNSGKRPSR
jgi:PD-(D/E)XK endonuclease